MDLKGQPDPSPILSQLSQNSALQSDLPAQARNHAALPPHDGPLQSLQPLSEPAGTMAEPSQPKNIRPLRRRAPPPSKVMIVNHYHLYYLGVHVFHPVCREIDFQLSLLLHYPDKDWMKWLYALVARSPLLQWRCQVQLMYLGLMYNSVHWILDRIPQWKISTSRKPVSRNLRPLLKTRAACIPNPVPSGRFSHFVTLPKLFLLCF